MLSTLLYATMTKVAKKIDVDNEDDDDLDSDGSLDDKEGLNYQTYTISCNEYT